MAARSNWKIVGQEARKGLYSDLTEVARRLEVEYRGAPELRVTINGTPVTFALELNSGTVTGLIIKVSFEGPPFGDRPFIVLTAETARDREGKARGISDEVQLGDAEFDKAVYIDSDASEPEVRRLLSRPQARGAVRQLVAGGASLKMTPAYLTGTWETKHLPFEPARVVERLEALLTLAEGGGPRHAGAPRRGVWLSGVTVLSFFGAFPWLFHSLSTWGGGWKLPVLGAAGGMVAALALRPALARLVAGDSASFGRYRLTAVATFFTLALMGPAALVQANGMLDRSTPIVVRGTVMHVGSYDDDSGRTTYTVRWDDDGPDEDTDFHPGVEPGAPVFQRRSTGALGFPWTGPVTLGTPP